MELLANVIGMRCYGEDEFCKRSKDTDGEQAGGKKNDGGGAPIYRGEGRVWLRQLPNEVAMETAACHSARKR